MHGKTVLAIGATSAVGHYAVQMAVLAGATVIGTVGSAERLQHALAAGVATTIHYQSENVAERVRALTGGRGADAIVDVDFSSTAALLGPATLAARSMVACYGSNPNGEVGIPFRAALFGSHTIRFFLVYDLTRAARQAAPAGLQKRPVARLATDAPPASHIVVATPNE